MNKKGYVIIYVILFMIPVMMVSLSLIDISITNLKTSSNILAKQQACYNAEAGVSYGLKLIKSLNYPETLKRTYYLSFDNCSVEILDTKINDDSIAEVKISSQASGNKIEYTISSTGKFMGCCCNVVKTIEKE